MGKRVYLLNEKCFDKINTHAKAYALGFIAADGYITKSKYNSCLGLHLHKKDEESLNFIKGVLGSSSPIYERYDGGIMLRVFSRRITDRLINIGITERKSLTIEFDNIISNIPSHLHSSFILGVFDGDGSIYKKKDRKDCYQVSIVSSSKKFIQQLKNYLFTIGFSTNKICEYQPVNLDWNTTYALRISCKDTIKELRNYLYGKRSYGLKRKRKIFFSMK